MDVVVRYTKLAHLLRDLEKAAYAVKSRRPHTEPLTYRSHRLADRVPPEARDKIIDAYAAGESAYTLAEQYGIGRNSVLALVTAAGLPRHIRRMSETETDEAVRLYQQGLSFVSVGKQIGFGPTAVADALKRRNVATRSRQHSVHVTQTFDVMERGK